MNDVSLSKIWLRYFVVLKFIYSEKATNFCEISTVDLSYVVTVKSTVEISQKFVAFSEYMNFTNAFGRKLKHWNECCSWALTIQLIDFATID